MMQRIFVTGATGFIGSHVVQKLLFAGLEVHALCRALPKEASPIHWHEGNLKDPSSLKRALASSLPHTVIHCAAYGIRHQEQNSQELFEVNFHSTLSFMELAAQYRVQRWIQTGSCFEYPSQVTPLLETTPPAPINLYGVMKSAATLLSLQQGRLLHMPVAVLRLFGVYGPLEAPERLIPTLISSCMQEKLTPFSAPTKVRDFVYVEDVADLYASLATTNHFPKGEIFNIGSGIPRTLEEVGKVIESAIGLSGYFLWGQNPNRPQEHLSLVADITKSQKELGWNPKTSLLQGLTKTIECLRSTQEKNVMI